MATRVPFHSLHFPMNSGSWSLRTWKIFTGCSAVRSWQLCAIYSRFFTLQLMVGVLPWSWILWDSWWFQPALQLEKTLEAVLVVCFFYFGSSPLSKNLLGPLVSVSHLLPGYTVLFDTSIKSKCLMDSYSTITTYIISQPKWCKNGYLWMFNSVIGMGAQCHWYRLCGL